MKLENIQELWTSDCVLDDIQLDTESKRIPEEKTKRKKDERKIKNV